MTKKVIILIEDLFEDIEGKKVTGFISIRTPLKLAGAEVVDKASVTDGKIKLMIKPKS